MRLLKGRPEARPEVLRAYWHLACERQRIFHARTRGEEGPWTEDPILLKYKFCNAYRASDRVSQDLIRQVIYPEHQEPFPPEDTLFRIVLYRLFSRPETWRALEQGMGGRLSLESMDWEGADRLLRARSQQGLSNYTAAFILCANRHYGHPLKHQNHLALLQQMFSTGEFPAQVRGSESLRELNHALAGWPLIGPFMAYQLAIDLNYSPVTEFSESEFTVAGPGARRGIRKVFKDLRGWKDEAIIQLMQEEQEEQLEAHGLQFQDLWGRRLQSIDCQNLFCETDKYSRVAFPHLASNRSKIKQNFRASGPLPPPFYPPKWGLALK